MPLLSIVIPCYNYAHLLPRALDSVLSQADDRVEVVVVNDGSPDDTAAVMEAYLQRYPQGLFYIEQANAGPSVARNRGIDASSGDYLLFLDADDELLPQTLALLLHQLQAAPQVGFWLAGHQVDEEGARARTHAPAVLDGSPRQRFTRYIDGQLGLSNGCCVIARQALRTIRFPESLRRMEDIPVFALLMATVDCCRTLDWPLLRIHRHAGSLRNNLALSQDRSLDQLVEALFEAPQLPADCQPLRRRFYGNRLLSQFRRCYKAKQWAQARSVYQQALQVQPFRALRWTYLGKWLRCLGRA